MWDSSLLLGMRELGVVRSVVGLAGLILTMGVQVSMQHAHVTHCAPHYHRIGYHAGGADAVKFVFGPRLSRILVLKFVFGPQSSRILVLKFVFGPRSSRILVLKFVFGPRSSRILVFTTHWLRRTFCFVVRQFLFAVIVLRLDHSDRITDETTGRSPDILVIPLDYPFVVNNAATVQHTRAVPALFLITILSYT